MLLGLNLSFCIQIDRLNYITFALILGGRVEVNWLIFKKKEGLKWLFLPGKNIIGS